VIRAGEQRPQHRGNAVGGYKSQALDAAMDAGIDSVQPLTDSLEH
jgi:hypothetical protein